ncbi:TonB-dependent receptor [Nitrosococcus halophilus Nc 4]|uniref:TonB-dependent receptor n=2 Tax=Nitrosococcus halophilus TaxID=133539 RepID=D5C336_NITHN|nr:TonB-dependent receptor [Nitrosococcus halophilus Nc 4]
MAGVAMIILLPASTANAQEGETVYTLPPLDVIGITPLHGVGLSKQLIPSHIQGATAEDLKRQQSLNLSDFLNQTFGSINLNAAQNNPFQPDLQYRGFTASPLLGLPQGLAVFQDGVRINEPFGDAVNWDLIPPSAIASINLMPGSNPLFGLNALGGALSIQTKDGFTAPGHAVQTYGGSFGRAAVEFESGANNGALGYFITGNFIDEAGWRDESPSQVKQIFADFGWQTPGTTLDLKVTAADTDLNGNGAAPIELLARDREAVFTFPDNTQNELVMVNLIGDHWLTDTVQLTGNAYYRRNDRDTFNGDGQEEFEVDEEGFLVEADNPDERVVDRENGEIFVGEADEDELAINNKSQTEQESYGVSFQSTFLQPIAGRDNQLILGVSYAEAEADFNFETEMAQFTESRGTRGLGPVVADTLVSVNINSRTYSFFFTDTFSLTEALAVTFSGRYNHTEIELSDQLGTALNGEHSFSRFNPAVGLTYAFRPEVNFYGNYSESSRAPTPSELTCADPEDPCRLPNSFVADPPLEQVVAKTGEAGFRGTLLGQIDWNANWFHTRNEDDILFQTTGGVTASEGFFENVGETLRQGVEVGLRGRHERWRWFAHYTYLEATFETPFIALSPSNPQAEENEGRLQVEAGDRIPGLPKHNFKVGADYWLRPNLSLGFDVLGQSSLRFRGDESNDFSQVPGFVIANLRGRYIVNKHLEIFARVQNLFDQDYETFGVFGEPDEAPGLSDLEDPRFLGPGAPIGAWVGVRLTP